MSNSDPAEQLARLSPEQRALLFQRLKERQHRAQPAGGTIGQQNRARRAFPLSFAQERLWFLDQFEPNSPLYNVPRALRIQGIFRMDAFQRALETVVARHEALRTTFPAVDGTPHQCIHESTLVSIPLIDLQHLPQPERLVTASQIANAEARRPFDLSCGPLIRCRVLRLDEQEHIILLTMHHIISDAWSSGILIRELLTLLESFGKGITPSFPELPIQYVDFAVWQREWLQGARLEEHLAYWQQQLADIVTLQLPTDYPRPPIQTFTGSVQSHLLPESLTRKLRILSQREGTTLFMILLTAFNALLFRYTRQRDIAIGTLIANRNRAELEQLIGFFVNTLVLRTHLLGDPSFRDLLSQVREVCLAAYAHQDLPFERLVDALQPERDLSHSPLFQVLFTLQNTPAPATSSTSFTLSFLDVGTGTSKFDMAWFLTETSQGIGIEVEYNTDLFTAATIARMLAHYQVLLEAAIADPNQRISRLPLLTEEEHHQVLITWNATDAEYPRTACIHHLIETQARDTPDRVALVFAEQSLTYRELDHSANQLAHYLLHRLGPSAGESERRIGICVERSPEMIMGILGILKAGCAYVPLDPDYPKERLAFVLKDADVAALLTQTSLRDRLPVLPDTTPIVYLDDSWNVPGSREASLAGAPPPIIHPAAGHIAYVIYTSGSTGQPKGVQIPHEAVVNFLTSMRREPGLTSEDTLLSVTSLSFDIAGLELFLPLSTGARIVLASHEIATDGERLIAMLASHGITIMQATPSTWRLLVEAGWQGRLAARPTEPPLKILCGGEALPADLARQLLTRGSSLWNLYGPTETTIWSAIHQVTTVAGPVPIGRPIANTQLYLLDQQMDPVPVGVPGELYIGGVGLSYGYFRRPGLTAERFVPNPFSPLSRRSSTRLYATGDLARYRADGSIEFLGRIDHQVKVHGYRIELQEIEAVLAQHPSVRESIVTAREDPPLQKRLVAYVVPDPAYQGSDSGNAWQSEQAAQWRTIWDETYRQPAPTPDPTLNIVGWNSSYTHLPIPEEEMREWVDGAVARILARKPQRVLEIGCGTGLLLLRIAPYCMYYHGTDFSAVALEGLRQEVQRRKMSQVALREQEADHFAGIAPGSYDAVILNSVVQYFPSAGYLLRVLAGAIQAVAPGGFIFIGDVRSQPLLETFHATVQLHQAPASLARAELQQLVRIRMAQEEELVIAPAFFAALQQQFPQVSQVQIQLKRGRYHNELTRFRYDVVLHVDPNAEPAMPLPPNALHLNWQQDDLSLATLYRTLAEQEPDIVHIVGIPNARLQAERRALELIMSDDGPSTVAEIRSLLAQPMPAQGVDPEALWELCDTLPYETTITWSASYGPYYCDATLVRHGSPVASAAQSVGMSNFASHADEGGKRLLNLTSGYTNDPLQANAHRRLVTELRSHLKAKLPDYMIPAAFVLLAALPRTPNGKVDRRTLPAPGQARPALKDVYAAPRTAVEEALARIWAEVLDIERVGIHDNFFELGGNSLLIIRMVAKAAQAGIAITARQVFQHQTIAELSVAAGTLDIRAEQGIVTGLMPAMPGQRFVLAPDVHHPEYFNLAYVIHAEHGYILEHLEQTLRHLLRHHDALRLCLASPDAAQPLLIAPLTEPMPLMRIDISQASEEEARQVMRTTLLEQQTSFNLRTGPLFKLVLFDRGPNRPGTLLALAHYFVADIESWQILISDLIASYEHLRQGEPLPHLAKTTSFKGWAERLNEYAQSDAALQELPYWLAKTNEPVAPLPLDDPAGANTIESSRYLEVTLTPEETATLVHDAPRLYDAQMDAVVLTALASAFARWTGYRPSLVRLFTHGREPLFEDMDVSGTVGAFATDFPVLLNLAEGQSEVSALRSIQEQLRHAPNHGIGYGILRFLSQRAEADALRAQPRPNVVVNYIGERYTDPSRPQYEVTGPYTGHFHDAQTSRPYSLQITGRILDGSLHLQWDYSQQLHYRATIETVAQNTVQALQALAASCRSLKRG